MNISENNERGLINMISNRETKTATYITKNEKKAMNPPISVLTSNPTDEGIYLLRIFFRVGLYLFPSISRVFSFLSTFRIYDTALSENNMKEARIVMIGPRIKQMMLTVILK